MATVTAFDTEGSLLMGSQFNGDPNRLKEQNRVTTSVRARKSAAMPQAMPKTERVPRGYDFRHVQAAMRRVLKNSTKSATAACRDAGIADGVLSSFLKEDPDVKPSRSMEISNVIALARAFKVTVAEFIGECAPDEFYQQALSELERSFRELQRKHVELLSDLQRAHEQALQLSARQTGQ